VKTIIVKSQSELDALPLKFDEFTYIEIRSDASIEILLRKAFDADSSQVTACGSSQVTAYGSSQVTACGSSQVRACGSSQVRAYDSSQVRAYDSSGVHVHSSCAVVEIAGFAVAWLLAKAKVKAKGRNAKIVTPTRKSGVAGWLTEEGIKAVRGKVVLFKRVSKDLKTQEGTSNETTWTIGEALTVPNWSPTSAECGAGKFHACSGTWFCDQFRSNMGDRYIAVEIAVKDLHAWDKPSYPHKIAFRAGRVLHEVNWSGNKIEAKAVAS